MFSFPKQSIMIKRNEIEAYKKIQEEINREAYEVLKAMYLRPITNTKNTNDFHHILSSGEMMIDKSSIINEIMNDLTLKKIFLGPSCGKTFNLSMLRYFLDKNIKGPLFNTLNICKIENWRHHYKKYSVIYLDFSDVQANCKDELKVLLHQKMSILYQEHAYLLENESMSEHDRKYFNAVVDIADMSTIQMRIQFSLKRLAKLITEANHHLRPYDRPIIIINHYDDLMSSQYLALATKNKRQEEPGWELLQSFFLNGLKDTPYLKFSIISGKSIMPKVLPNNCVYLKADSMFACSFKEMLNFLKQDDIVITPDLLTELSLYDYPDYIRFSERCYHPKKIIQFVKENRMVNKREDQVIYLSSPKLQPDTLPLFFNKQNKPQDAEEKLIDVQDMEILKPYNC